MKKVTYLIAMLLVFIINEANAQNESPKDEAFNSLQLNWGMGNIIRQDMVFSPVIYKKWSAVNTILAYSRSKKLEQRIYVKFGMYKPSISEVFTYYWDTPDETETSAPNQFYLIDLNYSLGKAVIHNENLKLTVGGRSRNRLHASYNTYGVYWLQHFGYNISFGLDAWSNLKYSINEKHSLEANIALPLLTINSRSPYMAQDDEFFMNTYSHKPLKTLLQYMADGKMKTVKDVRSFDFDVSYYYTLSDRWDIGGSYWFSANINELPKKLTSFENVFYISWKLKF